MSISSVYTVKDRIRSAKEKSPIAVFRTSDRLSFDAVFADTLIAKNRIKYKNSGFVGVFHGDAGEIEFNKEAFK